MYSHPGDPSQVLHNTKQENELSNDGFVNGNIVFV